MPDRAVGVFREAKKLRFIAPARHEHEKTLSKPTENTHPLSTGPCKRRMALPVHSVGFNGVEHGLHVFGGGVIEARRGFKNVAATRGAVVDKLFGLVYHLLLLAKIEDIDGEAAGNTGPGVSR